MAKQGPNKTSQDEPADMEAIRKQLEEVRDSPQTPQSLVMLVSTVLMVLAALLARIETLEKQLFGRRSEKMPRPGKDPNQEPRRASRQKRTIHNQDLPEETHERRVNPEEKMCSECGGSDFKPLGFEESFDVEYRPGRLVRRRFRHEKCVCANGCSIIQAPAAPRVGPASSYGPMLHAHVVVSRCLDAIPIHRQADQLARVGCRVAPHVLNAMFHRVAAELKPIYDRLVVLLAHERYINADETPQPQLAPGKTRRSFIWTFVTLNFAVYVYSATRSGEVPRRLLEGSKGVIQVDGHTGYNSVTGPGSRARAGCNAHSRRKFFDSNSTAPEFAKQAMAFFHQIYRVEQRAKALKIDGTDAHLAMRKHYAKPLWKLFRQWLVKTLRKVAPKSPIAAAIKYALNQWEALTLYLRDPKIAPDNNIAELRLRVIALGRKNSLFVGSAEGGENFAALMTLVTSARMAGLDPASYIAHVLVAIQDPRFKVDDLLPHRCKLPAPSIPIAQAA